MGFILFLAFGLGYFATVFSSAGLDTLRVMFNRSKLLPVTGTVEKIYVYTENRKSPSNSNQSDILYRVGVKIRYEAEGKEHWIAVPLPVLQEIPDNMRSIDEVMAETDRFSPNQPLVVKKRSLSERDARILFERGYDPVIKKELSFAYLAGNAELNSFLVGNGVKSGLGLVVGLTLGILAVIVICIQVYFRRDGAKVIGLAYLVSLIGIASGTVFAFNSIGHRTSTLETSSQDLPKENEIVFKKGMTLPDFPL